VSDGGRTQATVRKSRWPGWVWAVPIAALGVVAWLAIRHVVETGPTVTVTFASAEGVAAHDTKVHFKGMEVGEVDSVDLAPDRKHVVVTLHVDGDLADALTDGTRFWIVGGQFSLGNLSAIKSVISGPYIQIDPAPGKPARHFTGLAKPPAVMADASGTRFVLHADKLGSVGEGAPVYYRDLKVGTIESYRLVDQDSAFDITVFVQSPYDRLVRRSSHFWDASALRLSFAGGGVDARLASLEALLSGGVAFATPAGAAQGPPAEAGERFTLYDDEAAARTAPVGDGVAYLVRFDGAVGDLKVGAPVKLDGFRVGSVARVGLRYDPASGALDMPVTIELTPRRILGDAGGAADDDHRARALNEALATLVARGLRAKLEKSPPLVGGSIVALAFVAGAPPAGLGAAGVQPEIPAAPSDDIASLQGRIGSVVAKIDGLPLAEIGRDLRSTAGRVNKLASSSEVTHSLQHLDSTLEHIDRETAAMSGKIGPMVEQMRQAAEDARRMVASANAVLGGRGRSQDRTIPAALRELTEAARSIKALADYLDRHPEALLHGKDDAR
jgi:paraquat-inducible protein B